MKKRFWLSGVIMITAACFCSAAEWGVSGKISVYSGVSDTYNLKISVADSDCSWTEANYGCVKKGTILTIAYDAASAVWNSPGQGGGHVEKATYLLINDKEYTGSTYTVSGTTNIKLICKSEEITDILWTMKIRLYDSAAEWETSGKISVDDIYTWIGGNADYSLKVNAMDGSGYWMGDNYGYVKKGTVLSITYNPASLSYLYETGHATPHGYKGTDLSINGAISNEKSSTYTVLSDTVIKLFIYGYGYGYAYTGDLLTLQLICDRDAPDLDSKEAKTTDGSDYTSGTWTAGNVTFTFTGSDATSGFKGYEISTDEGNSCIGQTSNTYTVSTEGSVPVWLRAVDKAGNVSDWKKWQVRIDKTKPHIGVTTAYSGGVWSTGAVTYRVEAADSVSGVASFGCTDSGVEKTFSGANPYEYVVTSGEHAITFYAVDEAGNEVTAGPYTAKVDLEAPALRITGNDAAEKVYTSGTWTNGVVEFTLSGSDGVSGVKGYEYKQSETGSILNLSGNTYTAGSTQQVWFRAVDNAGNRGVWTAYSVDIDKSVPVITLGMGTAASGGVYYLSAAALKKVTCSGIDSGGSGIQQRSCSVDGALPVIYSAMDGSEIQNSISQAGQGKHTYTLAVTDNAGNSTSKSVTVLYDDSAVSGDDTGLALGDAHRAGTTILTDTKYTADITNAVPVVRVQSDGGAQGGTVTWTLGGKAFTGIVGGTAVQDGKGGSWYPVTVTARTDGAGTAAVSEAEYASYVKGLSDGGYPVSVTVTDLCGNAGTKQFVLTKDSAAPKPVASWLQSVETDSAGNVRCKISLPAGTEKTSVYQFKNKAGMTAAAGSGFAGENPVYSNSGTDGIDQTITCSVQRQKAELYLSAVDGSGNYEESVLTVTVPDAPAAVGAEKVITTDTQNGTVSFYLAVANPPGTPAGIPVTDIDGNMYTVTYKTVYKCIGLKENKETGESVSAGTGTGAYVWTVDDLKAAGAWGTGTERSMHIWAEYGGPSASGAAGTNPSNVIVMLNREGAKTSYTIPDSAPVFCAGTVNWPDYIGSAPGIGWVSASDPDGDGVWYRVRVASGGNNWYTDWTGNIETVFAFDKLYVQNAGGTQTSVSADDVKASASRSGLSFTFDAWAGSSTGAKPEQTVRTGITGQSKTYDASHCDFTAPVVTADDALWNSGFWSNEVKFKYTVTDGGSGVKNRLWKLEPVDSDNRPDTSGGRPSYGSGTDGSAGSVASFFVEVPALTGKYKLTLTATDKAGNSGTVSVYGLFDTAAPEITGAQVSALADSSGWTGAWLTASDEESGVRAWTWRQGKGAWESWMPWKNGGCRVKPDWRAGSSASLSFKVKDEAGNESGEYEGGSAEYNPSVPGFSVVLTGVTGDGQTGTYVTDTGKLNAAVRFTAETETGSGLTEEWGIVRCRDNEETDAVSGAAGWKEAESACAWSDGGTYRVKAVMKNRNGVSAAAESCVFTVDTTAPGNISVSPVFTGNRSSCCENERFDVRWSGGEDEDTGAVRTVELYQKNGTAETVLNSIPVCSGAASVRIGWGTGDISWNKGNFFIRGRAVNGAGTESVSAACAVPVSGRGMTVYMPDYVAAGGTFGASWAGVGAGSVSYRYGLYTEGAGTAVLSGTTAEVSAVFDLTGSGLSEGDKVCLEIEGFDAQGKNTEKGSSLFAIVDGSAPEVRWTSIPDAVNSAAVSVSFKAEDGVSGIKAAEWCVQKKGSGGWGPIPGQDDGWNTYGGAAGTVTADLSPYVTTGDYVRFAVRVENGAGQQTTVWTGGMVVDDSAPPAPLVIDQGAVVSYTKQNVTCSWRMSEKDPESGVKAYYWGWYYAGETTDPGTWPVTGNAGSMPGQWTKVTVQAEMSPDETASVDLRQAADSTDGKTIVFAVKAVNGAGLETEGYSDGIILDSTAPYVHGIGVYGSSSMKKKLYGYTAASDVADGSVYVQIEDVDEEESWVEGAYVQAYRLDSGGKRSAYGAAVVLKKNGTGSYCAAVQLGGSLEESAWIFEAGAEDAGGNVSAAAESGGFIVEGSIPAVTGLEYTADINRISLDWNSAEDGGGSRWVSGYSVRAVQADGTVLVSDSVQSRSDSFVWRNDTFNLKDGDSISITVSAYSYTGAEGKAATRTLTIDLIPPSYDAEKSKIPYGDRVTYWYDSITGHAQYGSGKTGTRSIEWSAVLVPGEEELTGWQETTGVNLIDLNRKLMSVRGGTLSWWQGKKIRIRLRAANGMGIWSGITNIQAIEADTTDPEIRKAERSWAWTNESGSVGGWKLTAEDDQSGILAYRLVVVPEDTEEDSFDWKNVAAAAADGGRGEAFTIENREGGLTSNKEGSYKPLLAVQNGSGHWSVCSGTLLMVDRTAPSLISGNPEWTGCQSQVLTVKDTAETVFVSNGPEQAYSMRAGEAVQWDIRGEGSWFTEQTYPETTAPDVKDENDYTDTAAGNVPFGTNPAGYIYTVEIAMTDRAGNTGRATAYLRYNREPQITVRTDNLTVWPGHTRAIDELVTINDDEGSRGGDYPLAYRWEPANGSQVQSWTGGASLQSVYGATQNHGAVFTQKTEKSQTSYYPGTLTVTDRYGKISAVDLTIKVENTREGKLLVDEYWTGQYEITGEVTVPAGLTLTMDGSSVEAGGAWNDSEELYESGVTVEKGGILKAVTGGGKSSIACSERGKIWRGVAVGGKAELDGLLIREAERGITLGSGGDITMKNCDITSCITGLHLLGGTLTVTDSSITGNEEYGIKEDGDGSYSIHTTELDGNGAGYYEKEKTVLTEKEIKALEEE